MRIRSLTGDKPHPDYGGWAKFLKQLDLRDEADGVKFYGRTNCNYILFPNGVVVQNYGFNGRVLMAAVRAKGAAIVLDDIKQQHAKIKKLLRPRRS